MTLGELITREDLVGRAVELHDAQKYAYFGEISAVERKDETIVLALTNVVQSFEGGGGLGRWKHIPGFLLKLKESTSTELCEKTHHFTLPDGGRGYFLPPGQKSPIGVKGVEDE